MYKRQVKTYQKNYVFSCVPALCTPLTPLVWLRHLLDSLFTVAVEASVDVCVGFPCTCSDWPARRGCNWDAGCGCRRRAPIQVRQPGSVAQLGNSYIPLHAPARTRTAFFAARVSEKLRWSVRVSDKVRSGPCSGI